MSEQKRVAVLNVVGLTPRLIGESTPNLKAFFERGRRASVRPALPAVTCTAQSTYLTGRSPGSHRIVANGWYNRELAEHHFWKQSNHIVQGEQLWDAARRERPGFTCAKLFWWFNMYSSVDYSITLRHDDRRFCFGDKRKPVAYPSRTEGRSLVEGLLSDESVIVWDEDDRRTRRWKMRQGSRRRFPAARRAGRK